MDQGKKLLDQMRDVLEGVSRWGLFPRSGVEAFSRKIRLNAQLQRI